MTDREATMAEDPFAVELPRSPFPGLRPFEKREWPVFFGREAMTSEVVDRLLAQRFVVVHGDSGCGKSSLILAGVQAQLEQEQARSGRQWVTTAMRPGDAPLWALARALARDGAGPPARELRRLLNRGLDAAPAIDEALALSAEQRLCVLVDQFEELFRFAGSGGQSEARLFTDVLVGLARSPPRGLYLVLTMRSEFLGHCARYPGLAEAVNRAQYLLPGMERPALVRAIREPAKLYGGEVDTALADALIADVGASQDQLPLIQHGLMLMWARASGVAHAEAPDGTGKVRLTLDDLAQGTSLVELLSTHADAVMDGVAPPGAGGRRRIVEYLFRALTDINADGHAVRRPSTFGELCAVTGAAPEALREILDAFRADGVSFLTPYGTAPIGDETRIDISHEALIRCWHRLADRERGWLHREFQDGLNWQSLRVQAEAFDGDPAKVLSAAAVADQSAWVRALPSTAWTARYGGGAPLVRALIGASEEHRRREQAEAQARERAEAQRRSLARFVIGVGTMALLAFLAAVFAGYQYLDAYTQRQEAEEQRQVAEAQREQAVLQTRRLEQQIQETNRLVEELRLRTQSAATATSPDGDLLASVNPEGRLSLLDLDSGDVVFPPPGCAGGSVDTVMFSQDGRLIAATSGPDAWILDRDGSGCRHLQGQSGQIRRAAFNPGAALLATGGDDGICRLWDTASGELVNTLDGRFGAIVDIAFDASGERLIAKGANGTVREWRSTSGSFRGQVTEPGPLAASNEPLAYLHVVSDDDRLAASAWQSLLRQQGVVVPDIEAVGDRSPARSQLRYFRRDEEPQARSILESLRRAGADARLTYLEGYEDSTEIRPRLFEIWFARDGIGYWFPVVASIYDEASAVSHARRLQAGVARDYDVHIYRAIDADFNTVYAVTLGGYMPQAEAKRRADFARGGIDSGAYAFENRFWGRNLLDGD